jgi:hypothetical protein
MGPLKLAPVGFQQLDATALASSHGLTVPADAQVAVLAPVTAAVSWRDDGTAPTPTGGMQIAAGTYYEYWGNLSAIRLIASTGSPVLNVSFYKIAG